ncbi:MAG: hypothetical protein WC388_06580 [Bacteroidales bacterium]|jgi:hypothetical protein
MKDLKFIFLSFFLIVLNACDPDVPDNPDGDQAEANTGTVVFDFGIPARNVPESAVHRIDLSIAKDAYDLYRGKFLISANVSDRTRFYTFNLDPGNYYYQAGVTCTSVGDTCLWDGFPGGRFGNKWTLGTITIVKGERLDQVIQFNN